MNKISRTEDILFESMNKIGLYPKRQYPISKHHVDFAFPEQKLIIEVDGWEYHKDRKQREIDEKRRDIAENLGWRVKRFTAEEVYENPENVAWKIYQILGRSKNNKSLLDYEKKLKSKQIEKETAPISYVAPFNLMRRQNILDWEKKNPKKLKEKLIKDRKEFEGKKKVKKRKIEKENIKKVERYEQERLEKKKRERKKRIISNLILILIILNGIWMFNLFHEKRQSNEILINEENLGETPPISEPPKVEPIIVEGSKTDVIITNYKDKIVSLNVTYRIYSNWFGINSTNSKIFNVGAGEKKSFQVYFNDGCATAPCSVSIINSEEIKLKNLSE